MKPKMKSKPIHVDEFIDDPGTDVYASFVLNLFRLPAILSAKFCGIISQYELYCTYNGSRYRVVGASRLGDIWLHSNLNWKNDTQPYYQERVMINEVTDLNKYKQYEGN